METETTDPVATEIVTTEAAPPALKYDNTAMTRAEAAVPVLAVPAGPDRRIGSLDLPAEQRAALMKDFGDDEVEIRPDGLIYVEHILVRKRLCEVFGPGGWKMVPVAGHDFPKINGNLLVQPWELWISGVFIASAIGNHDYKPDNKKTNYSDSCEAVKSNALTRCCKDLGIASQCWVKSYARKWVKKYAVKVKVKKWDWQTRSETIVELWRRKDADPFEGEIGPVDEPATSAKAEPPPAQSAPKDDGNASDWDMVTEPVVQQKSKNGKTYFTTATRDLGKVTIWSSTVAATLKAALENPEVNGFAFDDEKSPNGWVNIKAIVEQKGVSSAAKGDEIPF